MDKGRRAFLFGGGAAVVAGGAAVVMDRRRIPTPPHQVPAGPVGEVTSGTFRSAAMQATVGWSIGYPHGSAPGSRLPVLLELHGRGDDHRDAFAGHALGSFLSAAVRAGTAPFAIVSVDGGDHSYWHRRSSGADPQRMLIDELLPLLTGRGLRTDRFAVGGWSMGGYGALLLAERLGPSRVAAVVPDSPAIWRHASNAAKGAFDSRADFEAHDVLASLGRLASIPIRVSCGTSDPFLPGVRALLKARPATESELAPGGHNVAWWQHAAPGQLAFVGRHLPV